MGNDEIAHCAALCGASCNGYDDRRVCIRADRHARIRRRANCAERFFAFRRGMRARVRPSRIRAAALYRGVRRPEKAGRASAVFFAVRRGDLRSRVRPLRFSAGDRRLVRGFAGIFFAVQRRVSRFGGRLRHRGKRKKERFARHIRRSGCGGRCGRVCRQIFDIRFLRFRRFFAEKRKCLCAIVDRYAFLF